jgi:hypothetical protein
MSRAAMESRRALVVGWLLGAAICGLVCGCASSVSAPKSLRQAAAQRLERANNLLVSGSYLGAYEAIQYDLRSSDPQIREPAWQFVNDSPQFFTHVLADVDTTVTQVHSPGAASLAKGLLLQLTEASSFDQTQVQQLHAKLDARVTAGNLDSSLPFVLTDNLRWFSSLETLEGMRVIFERSVAVLANISPGMKFDRNLLSATLTYVKSRGPGSDEYRYLGSALPRMPLSYMDLRGQIARLYPDYAESVFKAMSLTIMIETVPLKRLLEEDVIKILKARSPLLEVVREPRPDVLRITIAELQYEERSESERTQTAVVSYLDMNTLVAVFAVPRGASFLYDVTQGSVEIQYAYEMKAAQHGQLLHEKLIREKIGDTYYYCSNPRVQNVYGGLSRATVWPNADVEAYCARGGGRRAVTEYRGKIPERLTAEIAAIPVVQKTITWSQ